MLLHAIASTPAANVWQVLFRYLDKDGRTMEGMPLITLPARSYAHADSIVDAFNNAAGAR